MARKNKGLMSEFLHEYGRFKLMSKSKEELVDLLVMANARRKRETDRCRKEVKWQKQRALSAQQSHHEMYVELQRWKDRGAELLKRENEYQRWRNNVNELVRQENAAHNALFALQQCTNCKEKRWRKKYRQTYCGMCEFVGKYIHIVDDMLRQKGLPDNVKARFLDMRVAMVESREWLDKVLRDYAEKNPDSSDSSDSCSSDKSAQSV